MDNKNITVSEDDYEKMIDNIIKRDKKEFTKAKDLTLHKSDIVFKILDKNKRLMDDEYLYSENEEEKEIDKITAAVVNMVRRYSISGYGEDNTPIYFPEVCYLEKDNKYYRCCIEHGQGSFQYITLLTKEDIKFVRQCDILKWTDLINKLKE